MQNIFNEVQLINKEPLNISVGALEAGPPAKPECETNIVNASPPATEETTAAPPAEKETAANEEVDRANELKKRYHEVLAEKLRNRKPGQGYHSVASAQGKPVASVELWLVDTGCGHDLISKADIAKLKKFIRQAERPITFITANGQTYANEVVDVFLQEFGDKISPYILNNTPAVVSVGFRCMEMGCSFVWPSGQDPYFILPDGNIVVCEVLDYIPYIRAGAPKCQPKEPTGVACYACGCKKYDGCFACGSPGTETGPPVAAPGVRNLPHLRKESLLLLRLLQYHLHLVHMM